MSVTMRDAFGLKCVELGKTNKHMVVLDADVSASTKSSYFAKEFPDRFFNCGAAEGNMAGVAAGLAASGFHPVVNAFAIFLELKSTDQIRNDFCYNKLPVVIAGAYGGLSDSFDGASHQAITDIAIMRAMPNMEVIVPADNDQAALALEYAMGKKSPVYIRLNRNSLPDLSAVAAKPFSAKNFEGYEAVLLREGGSVTIAANGITASMCLEAAGLLAKDGIEAEVFSAPFVKPLGIAALGASVKKTGKLVTVEEHNVFAGFGSACLEVLCKAGHSFAYDAVGLEDRFGDTGPYNELMAVYGLSPEAIAGRVKKLLGK
ncbi:MAG: 1-deoxy-D-xylulose-5-phosphate synthase [Spirochaetes bacterium]|nr:1-deoxy-D-xylulose-5-phosphate synthase [Spirochaetota bacterium]